jgi:hypothetical protein
MGEVLDKTVKEIQMNKMWTEYCRLYRKQQNTQTNARLNTQLQKRRMRDLQRNAKHTDGCKVQNLLKESFSF